MTTILPSGGSTLPDFDRQVRLELGELFRIESLHRRGPMSLVYRASTLSITDPVALKVIPRAGVEERFHRGITVAAATEHPHIVPLLQSGETGQFFWYTMPLVQGRSLDRVIAESGVMDFKHCLRITEQVASALQYGHRRGVAHTNIKPENVIVSDDGWTLVTDFAMPGALERSGDVGLFPRLLAYTAPEVLEDGKPHPGSDQYSLAILIHECLTGAVPANPGAPDEPMQPAQANPRLALPRSHRSRVELPQRAVPALRRAMAPSPQDRFPTVLGFVGSLEGGPAATAVPSFAPAPNKKLEPRVLTMEPESHRRRLLVRLLLLVVLVAGVLMARRGMRTDQAQELADRFERWYEADVPAGGMVVHAPEPQSAPLGQPPYAPLPPSDSSASPAPERAPPPTAPSGNASRTVPRVEPPRPTAQPPTTETRSSPPPATPAQEPVTPEPGRLFVNSTPWGTVYLDGRPVGNTPIINMPVAAGTYRLRITHDGFETYEGIIEVAAGEQLRMTGIILPENRR